MTEVKRYNGQYVTEFSPLCSAPVYVSADDYDTLKAECEALRGAIETWDAREGDHPAVHQQARAERAEAERDALLTGLRNYIGAAVELCDEKRLCGYELYSMRCTTCPRDEADEIQAIIDIAQKGLAHQPEPIPSIVRKCPTCGAVGFTPEHLAKMLDDAPPTAY